MNKQKLTWRDIVGDTLLELCGQGHLSKINKIAEGHPKTNIKIGSTLFLG